MESRTFTFFGAATDADGMPQPFHNYFVVATPWKTPDSAMVSIVPLTADSPVPARNFLVLEGGVAAGMTEVSRRLSALPAISGLQLLL